MPFCVSDLLSRGKQVGGGVVVKGKTNLKKSSGLIYLT